MALHDFHFPPVCFAYMLSSQVRPSKRPPVELSPAFHGQEKNTEASVDSFEASVIQNTDEFKHLPEWQLACDVAASKSFSRSEFLPKFLLYVCAQQLAGKTDEITEQRIGIEVFQRPHGYNPGEDNIVRNYARLLRKRLTEYFDNQGVHHSLRIEIPRGGYVPHFQPGQRSAGSHLSLETKAPEPVVSETPREKSRSTVLFTSNHIGIAALAAAAFIGLLAGAVLQHAGWLPGAKQTSSAAHILWTQLFQQNRNLMIVPPDSGLGILENLTGQTVTLEEYASGKYLTANTAVPGLAPDNYNDLRGQRYTSMVGLKIASSLLQLPEFIPSRAEIRDARDMSLEDFKNSDVILIGSVHANPWVELFEKNLNFELTYTNKVDQSYIVNKEPLGAEKKIYRNGGDGNQNRTYGVIDYLPNLHNTGHVLIIQGLNMAATQAAAELLFNREAIQPVLEKARRSDGSLNRFELLIETTSIVATSPSAHIIGMRFYRS